MFSGFHQGTSSLLTSHFPYTKDRGRELFRLSEIHHLHPQKKSIFKTANTIFRHLKSLLSVCRNFALTYNQFGIFSNNGTKKKKKKKKGFYRQKLVYPVQLELEEPSLPILYVKRPIESYKLTGIMGLDRKQRARGKL